MAILEKKAGFRVRLRDEHPLPCTVDIEGHKPYHVTLMPNQWTTVPEPVYRMLQSKFTVRTSQQVPDFDLNDQRPHQAGESALTRTETNPGYIIEGLDE